MNNEANQAKLRSMINILVNLPDEESRLPYFYEMLWELNQTKTARASYADSRMEKILDFVEQHYRDASIQLEDAASAVALSRSHFCAVFKRYTGYTFTDYLISYRIDKACLLLEHTEREIGDILLLCGFNCKENFNELFRKKKKMTPTEFRKCHHFNHSAYTSHAFRI